MSSFADIADFKVTGIGNPFPGLRPFTLHENALFFGREEQTDSLLEQLAENRFVAVIGSSGSGKSSLVRAGLIPVLYGGFMTEVGSRWRIVVTRPGSGPIENLAQALIRDQPEAEADDAEALEFETGMTEAILRTSSLGLSEVIQSQQKDEENTLILIDQFEELFRYREGDEAGLNESLAFVNLLLEAVRNRQTPIYVILTMRSDFLGDCAHFRDLTLAINKSHYLIPRMSRDQLKSVIEGPVAVGGGQIASRLTQRLLNEVGENADQLTVLQHALMRTWQYWLANQEGEGPMDIQHYEAIGTMKGALSRHADEAYFALESDHLRNVCKKLFQSLTEKTKEHGAIRTPDPLSEIIAVSGQKREDLIQVIDKFRDPERSLLMPPADVTLNDNVVIDISHESLMWIWERLRNWLEEEHQSAGIYLRLAESAELYQKGEARTWRPPDLHLALAWREREDPTLDWAQVYHPGFERAMNFLNYSQEVYQEEVEREEIKRKREIRRVRITALILGLAAVVSILFLFFSVLAKIDADNARNEAILAAEEAEMNRNEATKQQFKAQSNAEEARKQQELAEVNASEALRQQRLAEQSQRLALRQKSLAEASARDALQQRQFAMEQMHLAEENEKEALHQKQRANISFEEAIRLRLLSAAKALSIKSKEVSEPELQGLLAYQAYKFNEENQGDPADPDVYSGLYKAEQAFRGKDYNVYSGHSDGVRSMAFHPQGKFMASVSSDGSLRYWNTSSTNRSSTQIYEGDKVLRDLTFSPDGSIVAVAGEFPEVLLFDAVMKPSEPKRVTGHTAPIRALKFSPDGKYLFTGSADSTIRMWSGNKLEMVFLFSSGIRDLVIDPSGKFLMTTTLDGRIHKQMIPSGNSPELKFFKYYKNKFTPVRLDLSPDGRKLAIGTEQGIILLWDVRRDELTLELPGHLAPISSLEFSPSGERLLSTSLDGTARIWNMESFNKQPIILGEHGSWVWEGSFNPDESYVVTGSSKGQIRLWPVDMSRMADNFCQYLKRNMSDKEWDLFIGSDLEYQETCEGKEKP